MLAQWRWRAFSEQGAGGGGPGGGAGARGGADHLNLPCSVADLHVMPGADEDEIGDVRSPALGPPVDVMDLAPIAPDATAGDHAPAVADEQCRSLGGGGEAVATAQVEDGAVVV